jgi:hypothetical protein
MPFPFLPAGAVVAASVLIGALTVFGLILRAMDRAIVGLRDMAVSTLVTGLKSWGAQRPDRLVTESPGATSSPWSVTGEPSRATAHEPVEPVPPAASDPQPELVDLGTRSIDREPAARR